MASALPVSTSKLTDATDQLQPRQRAHEIMLAENHNTAAITRMASLT